MDGVHPDWVAGYMDQQAVAAALESYCAEDETELVQQRSCAADFAAAVWCLWVALSHTGYAQLYVVGYDVLAAAPVEPAFSRASGSMP